MNFEPTPSKKTRPTPINDDLGMEDFEFKPITSGLGFHQPKASDIKPVFTDKVIPTVTSSMPNLQPTNEMNVYQNDLSLFYGQSQTVLEVPVIEEKIEKVYKKAAASERVLAYAIDVLFLAGIVGLMLTIMARTISMDLVEVWEAFPSEITPLVLTIFCGFYLIYFSIFDKSPQATVGKNILGIRVLDYRDKSLSVSTLLLRTFITLINFVSLGLFAYFDLQNKVTNSKVVRIN